MFYGWKVVGASIAGLALGYSVVVVLSFGVFIGPLAETYGWSRAEISFALTIALYTTFVTSPLIGLLVDKAGVRKPLICSSFLFGLTVCSLYWLSPALWHFYLMYFLLALLGAGTSPVSYSKTLVNWFVRRRGLALGIGLAGVGIGAALIPLFAQAITENYGWRTAYLGIGLLILFISVPVISIFFRDKPELLGLLPDGDTVTSNPQHSAATAMPTGLTMAEAIRSKYYWLLIFIFFLLGLTLTGVVAHLIPMLIDRGVSPSNAASIAATIGLTIIFGRIIAGHLMDRYFAPFVTIAFITGPVLGLALFAMGASGTFAVVGAILVGLAIGAEFDVMAFFIGRYIGLRSFGQVYGQVFAIFQLGCGIGPLLMGICYDRTGEYTVALWVLAAMTALSCILFMLFGPYPTLPKHSTESSIKDCHNDITTSQA